MELLNSVTRDKLLRVSALTTSVSLMKMYVLENSTIAR